VGCVGASHRQERDLSGAAGWQVRRGVLNGTASKCTQKVSVYRNRPANHLFGNSNNAAIVLIVIEDTAKQYSQ
jgi:hypothetical protein